MIIPHVFVVITCNCSLHSRFVVDSMVNSTLDYDNADEVEDAMVQRLHQVFHVTEVSCEDVMQLYHAANHDASTVVVG